MSRGLPGLPMLALAAALAACDTVGQIPEPLPRCIAECTVVVVITHPQLRKTTTASPTTSATIPLLP